jgi:peptidoglycan hydrolase-like protein with peptidoglycan-binding domain
MQYEEELFHPGLLEDTRSPEEKAKDFKYSELFASTPELVWLNYEDVMNDPCVKDILSKAEVQNQDGSYSCVSQAISLALAINNYREEGRYIRMSARGIYSIRSNKPGQGMIFNNAGQIAIDKGDIFEFMLPSEGKGEDDMNKTEDYLPSFDPIGKIYRAKNYIWATNLSSIDEVASFLNRGLPAIVGVRFGNGEWAKEVPTLTGDPIYGHGICALPKCFFMYQAILIQDSWGIASGNNGRRILTEDWFKAGRITVAFYFEDLKNYTFNQIASLGSKPKYTFPKLIQVGSKGHEVAMLQRCLGYLQDEKGFLFPLDVPPTGNYFGITRDAVKRFQRMFGLPETGTVDVATSTKLNEEFSK